MEALWNWFSLKVISPINWSFLKKFFNHGRYYDLTDDELAYIRKRTRGDYFFILIRRKTHLTTWLIAMGNFVKTGRWGYWSHGLMNIEYDWPNKDDDYRFIESTATGVHMSDFMQVFDCDSVCLRRPKNFSYLEWLDCFDAAIADLGKKYDTLNNIRDESKLNCVELLLHIVKKHADQFPHLTQMVKRYGTITPDMWYWSNDLRTVYEVRH